MENLLFICSHEFNSIGKVNMSKSDKLGIIILLLSMEPVNSSYRR